MITIDRMEGGQCRKYNNFSQDIKFVENTISDKARQVPCLTVLMRTTKYFSLTQIQR